MKSPFAFVCMIFLFVCWLRGWLFFLPSCRRVGGGNFITSTNKFLLEYPGCTQNITQLQVTLSS